MVAKESNETAIDRSRPCNAARNEGGIVSEQVGPYDDVKCHFCKKSAKNGPEHVAGYQRREKYANVGPWFDACEECARVPYEQPLQLQKQEDTNVVGTEARP